MARLPRVVLPNTPHHVTQRGNRRQPVFLCDDDYGVYLDLVATFARKAHTKILAYCLMPNHMHFAAVPAEADGLRALLGAGTSTSVNSGEAIFGRSAFIRFRWMQ